MGEHNVDVLRSEVDASGYDLVIEAGSTIRHVQLKAMADGGKRAHAFVNTMLLAKPAGCILWMIYDPATLLISHYLWFGGMSGQQLPDLGNKVARHSKGNAQGLKAERAAHRLLARSRFERFEGIAQLGRTDCLLFDHQQSRPV
ncbi:MAG: hypothetical protein ACRCY3_12075 [Sphingorhabdus sp.]